MTRINVGYNVSELTTKHLLSELREIKRVPNAVISGRAVIKNIPETFSLGTGHVKFFYDKLGYLFKRYQELYSEGIKRGFKLTDFSSAWDNIPEHSMNDYEPTEEAKKLIQERIKERLEKKNGKRNISNNSLF